MGEDEEDARFAALVEEHYATIRGFARRLTACADGADDLTHDTLERARRHQHRLRPGSNVAAWLLEIMRNLFVDRLRRKRREVPLEFVAEPAAPAPDPVSPWEEITMDEWAAAVEMLSPTLREPYLMSVKGLAHGQIAERLGIRANTVTKRISRARAELARNLVGRTDGRGA